MSDVWGTVYQLERDRATGNDPESLRREVERMRAALLNIQAAAERGFPIDPAKLAAQCRHALTLTADICGGKTP